MKKIVSKSIFLLALLTALVSCVGKSSFDCYYPPQSMRFCIIDSTLAQPVSWISNANKDSLRLYAVKNNELTPIRFSLDSVHFAYPVVISSAMADLAIKDSLSRTTEFRIYGSKNMESRYYTIFMDIRKAGTEYCIYYQYSYPLLNGNRMHLDPTESFWIGSILPN